MRRALIIVLFVGCSGAQKKDEASSRAGKDVAAADQVKAAVAALPKCVAGAEVGRLIIKTTMCTRMFCNEPCCNQCGWAASFEGMSEPVDVKRVREVLKLGERSLECEVKAWGDALAEVSLSVGEPACVAR